jgi:hypothetical protein
VRGLALRITGFVVGIAVTAAVSAQSHSDLGGVPVYAADGIEIGRVADVSSTGKKIDALRISTGAVLGFGERSVIIPQPAFMIRGKSITLPDLRAEDIGHFPDASLVKDETGDR